MASGSFLANNIQIFGVDLQVLDQVVELHAYRHETFPVPIYLTSSGEGLHHAIGDTMFL